MATPTLAHHVSRAKAERLVAAGRLIASTIALAAATIGYAAHGDDPHAIFIASGWWLAGAAMLWNVRRRVHPTTTPLMLVLDLVLIAILLLTTGGVESVYFPMIVMPPFEANILYGRRAILWVGAAGVLVFGAAMVIHSASSDARLMIVRFGVIVLLGSAVVLRADYEERVHRDVEHLATWPRALVGDREAAIRQLLAHAADTLRVRHAAAVWKERNDSAYVAQLDGDQFELDEETSDAFVAADVARASAFLSPGLRMIDGQIHEWTEPAFSPWLAERIHAKSIIGARFDSQTVTGWLFLFDRKGANADDVMLAEIVARLVSAGLDQINLAEMMRERATTSERMRLSRDLHDGLLQSLSGLAMHAEGARRVAESDPRATAARLQIVVEQLVEAQRSLRQFVDELRPELAAAREPLATRLDRVARAIEREWGVPVELAADIDEVGSNAQANEIVALLTEAATNAAKHSGATRIRGRVHVDDGTVHVHVEDNGRGFPFDGRFELPQLLAERRGPWSLTERVAALGGQLAIESSTRGARVEVRLPRAS